MGNLQAYRHVVCFHVVSLSLGLSTLGMYPCRIQDLNLDLDRSKDCMHSRDKRLCTILFGGIPFLSLSKPASIQACTLCFRVVSFPRSVDPGTLSMSDSRLKSRPWRYTDSVKATAYESVKHGPG